MSVPPGLVANPVPVTVTVLPPMDEPLVADRAVTVGAAERSRPWVTVAGELELKLIEWSAVYDVPRAAFTLLHVIASSTKHELKEVGSGATAVPKLPVAPRLMLASNEFDGAVPPEYEVVKPAPAMAIVVLVTAVL